MCETLKYDTIIIEGVDKTGKDILRYYLDKIGNHKYAVYERGCLSNIAYTKIYNRPNNYKYVFNDNVLYILLTADLEDLKIRFKYTNEPNIDIEKNQIIFKETFYEILKNKKTLEFNTSVKTPYIIAKEIIEYITNLNK